MTLLDDSILYTPLFSDVCTGCAHFDQDSVFGTRKTCKAFPDGLPAEVWLGEDDHTEPIEGDRGIQFEPINGGDRQDARNCGPNSHQCGDRCVPKTKKCRKKEGAPGEVVHHSEPNITGGINGDRAKRILKEQQINSRSGFNVVIDPKIKAQGVKAVVEEAERQIRDLKYEHGVGINPKTGDIVFQKSGGQTGVYFENSELVALKGAIFTHNHPDLGYSPESPVWAGATLSPDDVRIAAESQFAEMRAVGHEISYSIKPTEKEWSKEVYEKDLFPTLIQSVEKNQRAFRGDPVAVKLNLFDLAWKDTAKKHGLTYAVDKNRDASALRKQHKTKKMVGNAIQTLAVLGLAAFIASSEQKGSKDIPISISRVPRRDARSKPITCGPGTKICGAACIPEDHECHVGKTGGEKRKKRKKRGLSSKLLGLAGISAAGGLVGIATSQPALEAAARSLGLGDRDLAGLTRFGLASAVSDRLLKKSGIGKKLGNHSQSWLGGTIGSLATSKHPLRDLGKTGKAYLHNAATHPGNPFGQAVKRKLSKLKFDARRSIEEAIALTTEIPIELHRYDCLNDEITGLFSSGDRLYDFSINADDQFHCDDSSVPAQHYLIGWRVDSGFLREDRKPVCKSGGEECGGVCLPKGHKCRIKMGEKASGKAKAARGGLAIAAGAGVVAAGALAATKLKSKPGQQQVELTLPSIATVKAANNDWQKTAAIASGLVGISTASYLGVRQTYRAKLDGNAKQAEAMAKEIEVSPVKARQHSVVFGVGGMAYGDESPEVIKGERIVTSFRLAFSQDKGKDFKSVPIDNSDSNVQGPRKGGINDTLDVYRIHFNNIRKGGNPTAIKLAAHVIAYADANPDKQMVLAGHSYGGMIIAEAEEYLKRTRPEIASRTKSLSFGTQWYGLTDNKGFGDTHTIGSPKDPFTSRLPTRNLTSFDGVKGHSQGNYFSDPGVKSFVTDLLYRDVKAKPKTDSLRFDKKCGSGYTQEGHKCHKEEGQESTLAKQKTEGRGQKAAGNVAAEAASKAAGAAIAAFVAGGGAAAIAAVANRQTQKPGLPLPKFGQKKPAVPGLPNVPLPQLGKKKSAINPENLKRAAAVAAYVGALGVAGHGVYKSTQAPAPGARAPRGSAPVVPQKWHEVLGVKPNASPQEIKAAYRKLSKEAHPDLNPDDPQANAKFQAIAAAYEQATKRDPNFNKRIAKKDALDLAYRQAQLQHPRMDSAYWDLESDYSDRFDAAVARLDVVCGNGSISPGETCHVGLGNRIKQVVRKGNEREQRLRSFIKQKTGQEAPSRKEVAVMAAGAIASTHGHVPAVLAPAITRAALETGQRIYDSKTAKLRQELIDQIEHETAKELAGGLVGETMGTIASEAAKSLAHGIPGASLAAGVAVGASSAMLSQGKLADLALSLKRRRDSVQDETITKLKAALREDTGLEPASIIATMPKTGSVTVQFSSKTVTPKNPQGDEKNYEAVISRTGCTWRPL